MVGSLFVRLALKDQGFRTGLLKSQLHLKNTERHVEAIGRSITTLKRLAIAGFAGWGIKEISSSFIDAASEAEGFRVRLNTLLGSVSEGNRLFKEMSDFAARVPYEYREIMASATQLSGVLRGGVDEIKQWMPIISDLAAVSGLSIQETTGQLLQRRRDQRRQELLSIIESRVMKHLLKRVQENREFSKYITLVETSQIDPFSAAEEILNSGMFSSNLMTGSMTAAKKKG